MKHFFCLTCNSPIKIKEGDYLFTYNIECCNNHIRENVDLEDILSTKKEQTYICENHKKKNIIHCFDCNADLCLFCYKEFHNSHKMGYLRALNYEKIEKHYFEKELAEEKECYKVIIDELTHFKNELDLFINVLKSDLKNYLKFRCDLIDNISPEFTSYINIENVNNLFKTENFFKIKDIIKNFVFKDSFIEKYDSLKNIFELMFKRGKYIENEFIKDIFSKNIIPINEKYFMKIENAKFIILEKSLDLNLKKYKFNNIFESQLNYGFERLKIKENKNIKKNYLYIHYLIIKIITAFLKLHN